MIKQTEESIQKLCVSWFRLTYKNDLIWATPNGGKRGKFEAFRLKSAGVLAGVPDLFIPSTLKSKSKGLFIEMKAKKGVLSLLQKDMIRKLTGFGYDCCVCYSFEEFKEAVILWKLKEI